MSALKDLGQWREETDAHLARLDLVTEQHGEDLRAKRGADNKTLTAIRETQTEHGQKLDAIQVTLDNLAGGLRKVDRASESLQADMGMVKGRLGKVEDKLDKIDVRLDTMDDRFDKIDVRLDTMDDRFDKMDDRFDKMDDRFDKVDVRLDTMDEKLDVLLSR
jgi:chromosome segregation ATPase